MSNGYMTLTHPSVAELEHVVDDLFAEILDLRNQVAELKQGVQNLQRDKDVMLEQMRVMNDLLMQNVRK